MFRINQSLSLMIFVCLSVFSSSAQIVTDGTVGPSTSLSGPNFSIGANLGTLSGANLFHSFSQFNIQTGESASFSGPASIQNIFSRVTGGQSSTIDGLLRSEIAGANFYFLNPAGVMFGPNAQIDVGGAFAVSTADYLRLGNGGRFDAANPAASILNSEPVEAFGFVRADPASVSIIGSSILADGGQHVSIIAGDIEIDDAEIAAEGGKIAIISVGSPGEVTADVNDSVLFDNPQSFTDLGNLTLRNFSILNVDGQGGGRIVIRGAEIVFEDSEISSLTEGEIDGLGIDIYASGKFSLIGSRIDTSTSNSGAAGPILILANLMVLDSRESTHETGIFANSLTAPIDMHLNLRLSLNITHTFDVDLEAKLISPEGTEVIVFSRVGFSDDNFENTIFNEDTDIAIDEGTAPFSGEFRPKESFTAFSDEMAEGIWTLRVEDFSSGDDGTLDSWSLSIGDQTFESIDVPRDISNDLPPTTSAVDVDVPGLIIEIVDGFTPGAPGVVEISTETLTALGDPVISATAVDPSSTNIIELAATDITLDDADAHFELDESGIGHFVLGPPSIIFDGTLGDETLLSGPNYRIKSEYGQISGANLFHSFRQFNLNSGESVVFFGPPSISTIMARVTGGEVSNIDGVVRTEIDGADLFLLNPAGIIFGSNASLDLGGSITISTGDYIALANGGRFDASTPEISVLSSDTPSTFGFIDDNPKSLSLNGSSVSIPTGHAISLIAGDIDITGGNIHASGGDISLIGVASAGEVDFESLDSIMPPDLSSFSELGSIHLRESTSVNADGDSGGRVMVHGHDVVVEDNSGISSKTFGEQNGRGIVIDAAGRLVLQNNGIIASQSHSDTIGAGDAGEITISAGDVLIEDGSSINGDTTGLGRAADIKLVAVSMLEIYRDSRISSSSLGEFVNSGDGGDIMISAGQVTMAELSFITAVTTSGGKGGNISLNVESALVIEHESGIDSSSFNFDPRGGAPGAIEISADNMLLNDNSHIDVSTFAGGTPGDITISVANDLIIRHDSLISGVNSGETVGQGGSIIISSANLILERGGFIATITLYVGRAGDIDINVRDTFKIIGSDPNFLESEQLYSGITADSYNFFGLEPGATGDAGQITIQTRDLLVDGLGVISSSSTDGAGHGGDISINVHEDAFLKNIASIATQTDGPAAAGDIRINAKTLHILNSSEITAATAAQGSGGNIMVEAALIKMGGNANEYVEKLPPEVLENLEDFPLTSTISSKSEGTMEDSGSGGRIEIDVNQLSLFAGGIIDTSSAGGGASGSIGISGDFIFLDAGASIASRSTGSGDAGNTGRIFIGAANNPVEKLEVLGGSSITTDAASAGGGQITIYARKLIYLLNSQITTSVADGFGFGGDIFIDPINLVMHNSQILARAFAGDGGAITIIADNFIQSDNSLVDATSQRGNNGAIEIIAPDTDINADLAPLLGDFLDAASWVVERCSARLGGATSSLTVAGQGGVPLPFDDLQANLDLIGFDIETGGESGTGIRRIRELPEINDIGIARKPCEECR